MPVLEAVLHNATVKRVVESAFHRLEVSVAVIVCLLVGGHVVQNHLKLHQQKK